MARRRRNKKNKNKKPHNEYKYNNNKFQEEFSKLNENNNVKVECSPDSIQTSTSGYNEVKEPIVAPNGKMFYPCQSCSKIFPRESTCKSHMTKCCNKNNSTNINPNDTNNIDDSKIEVELNPVFKTTSEENETMLAPSGKLFYPCNSCSRIFPREATFTSHMSKCFNRGKSKFKTEFNTPVTSQFPNNESYNIPINNKTDEVNRVQEEAEQIIDNSTKHSDEVISNSSEEIVQKEEHILENKDIEKGRKVPTINLIEDPDPDPDSPISDDEDVILVTKETPKYDLSVYDYDEDTSDEPPQNKLFKCKECSFKTTDPIELLKHKRNEHTTPRIILPPEEIQKYFDYPNRNICPICRKPIKSKNFRSIFVKHLLIHTAGLFFECRICKKKFRRNDHLRLHEKRHVITFAELQAIQDAIKEDDKQV